MIAGVHDLRTVEHRRDYPTDVFAVGVVPVIMDNQVGIPVMDGPDQITDPFRGPQAAMILDAQQDVFPRNVQDLSHLADIVRVRVLRTRGEADRRFQNAARRLHLLEHRHHVGYMVEKIEYSPDVDITGEGAHRHPDHIVGIGSVTEEIDPPAEGLEHRVRHPLS